MSKQVILYVDDELLVLNSLEIELRKALGNEYFYEFAEGAEEALEIIDEVSEDGNKVILILSDWLMPEMKGDEFFKVVHQNHPEIVKIMLTGQANEEAISDARKQVNLYACLRKPWDGNELITVIKSGIGEENCNLPY
ncbi:MAG: response regulator, partial [Prochloron sp. SP5CPC1]|nr:response regulator [Candidatus Paraprochloron terpiosi SP5CPC1]